MASHSLQVSIGQQVVWRPAVLEVCIECHSCGVRTQYAIPLPMLQASTSVNCTTCKRAHFPAVLASLQLVANDWQRHATRIAELN